MNNCQNMIGGGEIRVHIWDQMVLIGIGLALFYTVFDSILHIFLSSDGDFLNRLFGPDISEIWARLTITCLFVIFGSHAQFTINKRVLAEAALRENEEKFRTVIETTPDGYFEADLNGKFTFFNDSLCRMLGYSRQEVATLNQREWLDEKNSQVLADTFSKMLENRKPVKSLGLTLSSKQGVRRYVESSLSLINDPKGKPVGFGGFIRDETQRRRAESLYRAKMAAEAASRTKSVFLASMSHEIRTPLNSIIGLVDLMSSSDLPPGQRDDLDVVKSSAYSLLSIVNNILDFSKIEAGKLELEQSPFSIRHFLADSLKIMGMKSHAKGIELAYRLSPGVPDRLLGDPTRLRQVLINLVDNAIKFTEKGEVIVMVAAPSLTESDVNLSISVVDTGIGIPKDQQRSIFTAYNQAGLETTRRYGGTGLGLAVSAQLVRLMAGTIKVKSQPGVGSRFRFTARFRQQQNGSDPRPAALQSAENHPELAGLSVLVVDDNASSRRIIREIVQNRGMFPRLASDAQEAVAILLQLQSAGQKPVDLIVLDSDMPATDGFALANRIRQQKISDARILMMLTFPHLNRKAELEKAGIAAGILKPFGPLELEAAIKQALGIKSGDSAPRSTTPQRITRTPARRLKVLVAEDTPFNQRFIMRLLGRWNHQAALVENGRQAVESWQKGTFDLILMDVQMPEMDGLTATKEIRRREAAIGDEERKLEAPGSKIAENPEEALSAFSCQHPVSSSRYRVPIIAMTAYAVKGDRERCLEAGMDGYIAKPIDADKLFWAIEKFVNKTIDPRPDAPGAAAIDTALLRDAFDGDRSFLEAIIEIFLSDYPRLTADLRKAATEQNSALLMRSAHSLNGMLKNFQAVSAAEIAFELEKKGKSKDFDGVPELIQNLENRISAVDKMLRRMLK